MKRNSEIVIVQWDVKRGINNINFCIKLYLQFPVEKFIN